MKKRITLCLVLISSLFLYAQEKKEANVSEKVRTEFAKLYPDAKEVKWNRRSEISNASFNNGGMQISITFVSDTLFSTQTEIKISALPEPVMNHMKKYYNDYTITRAGEIRFASNPDKKNICYGAEVTKGAVTKRIICYPSGDEMMALNQKEKENK